MNSRNCISMHWHSCRGMTGTFYKWKQSKHTYQIFHNVINVSCDGLQLNLCHLIRKKQKPPSISGRRNLTFALSDRKQTALKDLLLSLKRAHPGGKRKNNTQRYALIQTRIWSAAVYVVWLTSITLISSETMHLLPSLKLPIHQFASDSYFLFRLLLCLSAHLYCVCPWTWNETDLAIPSILISGNGRKLVSSSFPSSILSPLISREDWPPF